MFLWLDPIRLTQHGHPHPGPGRRQSRGSGPVPFIEALHQQRFFFIRLNFSEGTVKSPSYPPKAEPRAMPHLPSTKKRTESAHARPTSLQHPPRKSGGAGAFMSSGLRPTERVARSANTPDMATHRGWTRSTLNVNGKFLFSGRKSWKTADSSKWWCKRPCFHQWVIKSNSTREKGAEKCECKKNPTFYNWLFPLCSSEWTKNVVN